MKLRKNKIVPEADGLAAQVKQQEMMNIAQTIANTLGVPVEVIIQAAQGQKIAQKNTQPDGSEAGGQDARTV